MSYINFRVTGEEEGSLPLADVSATATTGQNGNSHSLTDGEELMAASAIIDALDELDNGEYLVIWKVIF